MTTPTATLTVPHLPWCHADQCVAAPGEPIIHRHLVGTVARTEVTVEQRVDPARPRSVNRAQVHVTGDGMSGMDTQETHELVMLLNVAHMFAAEVS